MGQKNSLKPKILFIYYMEPELALHWRDGLWASLKKLEKTFEITYCNLFNQDASIKTDADFVLGWGAFGSPAAEKVRQFKTLKGLCVGGSVPPIKPEDYDVLFYETKWYGNFLKNHPLTIHAFGVNTHIFKEDLALKYGLHSPVYDYLSVGSFSYWKRHTNILNKNGVRLVVGQMQKNNMRESVDIAGDLLVGGVGIMDMVSPEKLMALYNLSRCVYVPAEIMGGGERAVLEARACGRKVEVESDNPKLQELLTSKIWDQDYYARQLKKGVLACLRKN
jgi:hypothetical protein